ncbi:methyltransferase family protein [Rhodothalassium salexigens DSM 2132]|uniref:Methyltransferase family protein n=1 Tax=Rhodothalassium salexigens DSM 2132 TaxID=1188247 RepID=A0A4R2PEM9_RHOSA|nr:methyltransferase domain-containing protein [Rhodothalassium salexigens]MBB4212069.1 SAM-dependent methyltransferase [Rhodothalassium salexigens DSM 2132]MBK1638078.1 SAM-dependent methyltransferase [Rhodothalassium salexigens DSM 2132]TCP32944.1 methyltransferase family protein [Rhodothalassium salexigens DSM 2132]
MTAPPRIFDRQAVRRHRDRAAPGFADVDFLFAAAADALLERLGDVRRDFDVALDLSAGRSGLAGRLPARHTIAADLSPAALARTGPGTPRLAADEEWLPFAEASLDLVVSVLSLHWVNDLPGSLIQINRALKPDRLFSAVLMGGETLRELRHCLTEAEAELRGGVAPRISPMADVRDLGGLLQRAGFAMPVADTERLTVRYADPVTLLRELGAMGEGNALADRERCALRRDVLARAVELYGARYAGGDGRVPMTVDLIFLAGWSPGPDQPKPLQPGSAKQRLADALDTREVRVPRR